MGDQLYMSGGRGSNVATRTPIQFGPAVTAMLSMIIPEYRSIFSEQTADYLLYGFHRAPEPDRNFFVVIQAARNTGLVTAEVGLSVTNKFPYYKWSDSPKLGTFGYRERVALLMSGSDFSHKYNSANELTGCLRTLVGTFVVQSLRMLKDDISLSIEKARATWVPLYKEWLAAERDVIPGSELRYEGLQNEEAVASFIRGVLSSRKFDRFLGPQKFRYRTPEFFHCHVYLMAQALDFLVPPEAPDAPAEAAPVAAEAPRPQRMITWADIMGAPVPKKVEKPAEKLLKEGPALGDAVVGMCGRQPQSACVSLSRDAGMRRMEYAFLKSFSAVEALMGDTEITK